MKLQFEINVDQKMRNLEALADSFIAMINTIGTAAGNIDFDDDLKDSFRGRMPNNDVILCEGVASLEEGDVITVRLTSTPGIVDPIPYAKIQAQANGKKIRVFASNKENVNEIGEEENESSH